MTNNERKKLVELYNREMTKEERFRLIGEEEAGRGLGIPLTEYEQKSLFNLYEGGLPDFYFDGTPAFMFKSKERTKASA